MITPWNKPRLRYWIAHAAYSMELVVDMTLSHYLDSRSVIQLPRPCGRYTFKERQGLSTEQANVEVPDRQRGSRNVLPARYHLLSNIVYKSHQVSKPCGASWRVATSPRECSWLSCWVAYAEQNMHSRYPMSLFLRTRDWDHKSERPSFFCIGLAMHAALSPRE